jgi:hypothetical protein
MAAIERMEDLLEASAQRATRAEPLDLTDALQSLGYVDAEGRSAR